MKIMIDILHPAHVHFFKNLIKDLEKEGHKFLITTREKDIANKLLDIYNMPYKNISSLGTGWSGRIKELIQRNVTFIRLARKFKPDIVIGLMGATVGTTAWFIRKPTIVFWDTEITQGSNRIVFPSVDYVCLPQCFEGKSYGNTIYYPGYHELSYLHPNKFTPDPKVLKEFNLKKTDKFFFVRFVSWESIHDFGEGGVKDKISFIKELEKKGKVLISSEDALPKELQKYEIKVSLEKVHDLMAFATLFIGESATMATEAAVLGTQAIFISSTKRGYSNEIEKKYDLIYNCHTQEQGLKKALELLKDKDLKKKSRKKAQEMLKERIDVSAFVKDIVTKHAKRKAKPLRKKVYNLITGEKRIIRYNFKPFYSKTK